MSESDNIDKELVIHYVEEKKDPQHIRSELILMGKDESQAEAYIKEIKKAILAKRQAQGFLFAGSGAVLGFISCVLTIVNPIPSIYFIILYGLTSLAVVLICYGLYLLFE